MPSSFSAGGGNTYYEYQPVPSSLRFFIKKGAGTLALGYDTHRISLRIYQDSSGNELLLAAAHLRSKMHADWPDQAFDARRLRQAVERVENEVGHTKSVIIGDLNMDPFESGMVSADGLNAVMDKGIAAKGYRTYSGERHQFFYNPMWSRLGDESTGPCGTYYYNPSKIHSFYWHTFDQVLLRPTLLPAYDKGSLEIITRVANTSLIKDVGLSNTASDHLPVLLKLVL